VSNKQTDNPALPFLFRTGRRGRRLFFSRFSKGPKGIWGFTLVELIIATAMSALVIGIVSVCFSFVLKIWQSTQNQKPDQTFLLADLLERQLAESDPTPVKLSDNNARSIFTGQNNSIAFITAHSVKAISQGVPVIARYTYDSKSRVLYYSELLLDPYHPESIQKFISGRSAGEKETDIRSFGIDFPDFQLSYAGKEAKQFMESWESAGAVPTEVLLSWKGNDSLVHARVCMVNTPFPVEVNTGIVPNAGTGVLNQLNGGQ